MFRTKNLIHPGEILFQEFLIPMNISKNKLALDIQVPVTRINAIIKGTYRITADTALRLGKYFGTGPKFWCNLQKNYDFCEVSAKIETELTLISQIKLS